jgi:hypothetical protein
MLILNLITLRSLLQIHLSQPNQVSNSVQVVVMKLNNKWAARTMGRPNNFPSCETFQLVRPTLRERICILAQGVERGGFFR